MILTLKTGEEVILWTLSNNSLETWDVVQEEAHNPEQVDLAAAIPIHQLLTVAIMHE